MNYYNDNDPKVCAWLTELVNQNHIPQGDVDCRSITDVDPDKLGQYTQCHFFAGIGGWARALYLADVSPETPLWTGSAPCQPFSIAGNSKGYDDERHLAPAWLDLIKVCRPPIIFGEQVASPAARKWLGDLRFEMEALGYRVGAADLCAASVGAPHIRQRLFFGAVLDGLGHAPGTTRERRAGSVFAAEAECCGEWVVDGDIDIRLEHASEAVGGVADASEGGRRRRKDGRGHVGDGPEGRSEDGRVAGPRLEDERLADTNGVRRRGGQRFQEGSVQHGANAGWVEGDNGPVSVEQLSDGLDDGPGTGEADGFWRDADWLFCTDGKWRPVEPGTQPLAHGLSKNLADVLSIAHLVSEEVRRYAEIAEIHPDEVLRMVRDCFHTEAFREDPTSGGQRRLQATPVLLDILLRFSAACDEAADNRRVTKAGKQAIGRTVRVLRAIDRPLRTSRQRRPYGQQHAEPSDALHELSLVLARHAQAFEDIALNQAHASIGRVVMLRGYGNAIVPQVAAQFINTFNKEIKHEWIS